MPPAINIVDRIVGTPDVISYVANGNQSQQFDKVSVINFLALRLTGSIDTGGSGGPSGKFTEGIENLVSSINLSATGKGPGTVSDTLKACDFAWFAFHTWLLGKTRPTRTDVGSTASTTYAFESNATLFLGALDARALSSLKLTASFRDINAVYGTPNAAAFTTNLSPVLTVQAREVLGLPVNPSRSFLKESHLQYSNPVTKQDLKLTDLPVGNVIQRLGLKGTLSTSLDYADPSDTPFANTSRAEGPHFRIKANSAYTVMDAIYKQNQSENKKAFTIESWPAGYSVFQPRVPFNAANASRLDGFVDTYYSSGTSTIHLYPVEVVSK